MKLTEKQKRAIRQHWPFYKLRFMVDGTVMAQKQPGSPYGILYTPAQTAGHLKAVGL